MTAVQEYPILRCQICGHQTEKLALNDCGAVRGNTERFRDRTFQLWKCPRCLTIHSLDAVDFADIYSDYPLNGRKLDAFARGTMRNLLGRLKRAGLTESHSILDYGCGNGLFLQFLAESGYENVRGFDPYVLQFATLPSADAPFDCVVSNDTIEHCDDPRGLIRSCVDLVKPGGMLYVGTADSEPVEMNDLEPHLMRLHQPFHRLILTEKSLRKLGTEPGLELVHAYRRSYMDTRRPFANYRFLDELNKRLGHNLDAALGPHATRAVLRSPSLWFFGLFGYFFPSAYEPALVLRKPL